MALGISTGLSSAWSDAMGNGGVSQAFWDSAIVEFRDGTRPATADTAPTGTVGASATLPADAMAAAASHAIAKAGTWQDPSADASITATWFRIKKSGDLGTTNTTDKRIDGNLTVTGGGGDMTLDTVTIVATQPVTVIAYQHTWPA